MDAAIGRDEFERYLESERETPVIEVIKNHPDLLDLLYLAAKRICGCNGWSRIEDPMPVNIVAYWICAVNNDIPEI